MAINDIFGVKFSDHRRKGEGGGGFSSRNSPISGNIDCEFVLELHFDAVTSIVLYASHCQDSLCKEVFVIRPSQISLICINSYNYLLKYFLAKMQFFFPESSPFAFNRFENAQLPKQWHYNLFIYFFS